MAVVGNEKVEGVRFVRTRRAANGDESSSARAGKLEMVPNSEMVVKADAVLLAFGFRPNPPSWFEQHAIRLNAHALVDVVREGDLPYQTSNPRIFAAGDMVRGPDLVVTAIADARRAAESVLDYLEVSDMQAGSDHLAAVATAG